jgi:hypothetical protein
MAPCKEKKSKRYLPPRRVPPYVAKNCQDEMFIGANDKWYIGAKNKTQWRWVDADKRANRLKKGSRRKSQKKSRKSQKKSRKSQKSPKMVLRPIGA